MKGVKVSLQDCHAKLACRTRLRGQNDLHMNLPTLKNDQWKQTMSGKRASLVSVILKGLTTYNYILESTEQVLNSMYVCICSVILSTFQISANVRVH